MTFFQTKEELQTAILDRYGDKYPIALNGRIAFNRDDLIAIPDFKFTEYLDSVWADYPEHVKTATQYLDILNECISAIEQSKGIVLETYNLSVPKISSMPYEQDSVKRIMVRLTEIRDELLAATLTKTLVELMCFVPDTILDASAAAFIESYNKHVGLFPGDYIQQLAEFIGVPIACVYSTDDIYAHLKHTLAKNAGIDLAKWDVAVDEAIKPAVYRLLYEEVGGCHAFAERSSNIKRVLNTRLVTGGFDRPKDHIPHVIASYDPPWPAYSMAYDFERYCRQLPSVGKFSPSINAIKNGIIPDNFPSIINQKWFDDQYKEGLEKFLKWVETTDSIEQDDYRFLDDHYRKIFYSVSRNSQLDALKSVITGMFLSTLNEGYTKAEPDSIKGCSVGMWWNGRRYWPVIDTGLILVPENRFSFIDRTNTNVFNLTYLFRYDFHSVNSIYNETGKKETATGKGFIYYGDEKITYVDTTLGRYYYLSSDGVVFVPGKASGYKANILYCQNRTIINNVVSLYNSCGTETTESIPELSTEPEVPTDQTPVKVYPNKLVLGLVFLGLIAALFILLNS